MLVDDYDRDDYGVRQAVHEFLDEMRVTITHNLATVIHRDYMIAWRK